MNDKNLFNNILCKHNDFQYLRLLEGVGFFKSNQLHRKTLTSAKQKLYTYNTKAIEYANGFVDMKRHNYLITKGLPQKKCGPSISPPIQMSRNKKMALIGRRICVCLKQKENILVDNFDVAYEKNTGEIVDEPIYLKKCTVEQQSQLGSDLVAQAEASRISNLFRTKNMIKKLALNNLENWEYFLTLTYDPKLIAKRNKSKETDLDKVWMKMLNNWLNVQRRNNPDFQYLLVFEHHKSGQLHAHVLVAHVPNWQIRESINPHNGRKIFRHGIQLFNLLNYKLGFSELSKIKNPEKTINYQLKYITKEIFDDERFYKKKKFWYSKSTLEYPKEICFAIEKDISSFISTSDCEYYNKISFENYTTEIVRVLSNTFINFVVSIITELLKKCKPSDFDIDKKHLLYKYLKSKGYRTLFSYRC